MNWVDFIRLIRSLYGRGLPDLAWIQRLGLLAVKIAQIHAVRIDFLDREKCEHLARLYRRADAVPPARVESLLASYLDADQRAELAEIEREPTASASVGQVHRGRLRDGKTVAVKLVKRDVRRQFLRDVEAVRRFTRFVLLLYPRLRQVGDPLGILSDVEQYTLSELDLRNELEGQKTLRRIHAENSGRFDLSGLRFPEIHDGLSNENVLVSEFIEGKTFDELLESGALDYQRLLDLFRLHMFYVFGVGVFHGDIHPGNIVLSGDRICFVDTGYIGHVGDRIRKGLFNFMKSLAWYDYDSCARFLNEMAESGIDGSDYRRYSEKFLDLYSDFTETTVSQVSLTTKMMNTIKLGVRSGMVFDRGIFPVIRSLMYLDGMALRCRPDAVLMRDMRPFVEEGQEWFAQTPSAGDDLTRERGASRA
ncbi:MAG: ABC1 kinase family protein [Planctomycetota bacterium]|jgi:ubiquinone biosynthesis protein